MRKRVPAEVRSFLAASNPAVQEIALKARALVLEVAPGAVEQIDVSAKMLAYGFAATYKDMFCAIQPHKTYVNFGLPRGAELPDPGKLLTGTGKHARHVKLAEVRDADMPELRALLEASVAQVK